jgi:hypothetical protein
MWCQDASLALGSPEPGRDGTPSSHAYCGQRCPEYWCPCS